MITTGTDLWKARLRLGWSALEMADALRLEGSDANKRRFVQQVEDGKRALSGPVAVACESFLAGFRPE
jgi:hypothetical protein